MKTERQRQQEKAVIVDSARLYHFRCADGEGFEAVAVSESGAFCVLNAERPGMYGECIWSRKANDSDFRLYQATASAAPGCPPGRP